MIRDLIRREFGVALSEVSVGRLLRMMGLSPQRPLHRAYEQDPEAVQRWKSEQFPAIRAEAKKAGATVYFADEAGVRSDYHSGTTWAPVGRTPVVASTGARWSVNMLSAVSAQGKLRGTVKLVSGAAEADDLGVDTQPEGPSWARCRTRVTGFRRRSSRTACGCITGYR